MTVRRFCCIALLAMIGFVGTWASEVHIEISFKKGTDLTGFEFYVGSDDDGSRDAVRMECEDLTISADLNESVSGFYNLMSIREGGQVNIPLYIPSGTNEKKLKAEIQDGSFVVITNDADCKALSEFGHLQGMQTRRLWTEVKTEDEAKTMLQDYKALIAQADPKHKASDVVKKYIDLWAYTTNYVNISNLPNVLGKKASEISLRPADVMPSASEVMDDGLALNMSSSMYIICDDLRRLPTIDERLAKLRNDYKTQAVREKAEKSLMESFIQNFDYQNHYTDGLTAIGELTSKYNLPDTYLNEFMKRSSTVSGAAFPEPIDLVDKDGSKMDFGQFRGKYVYVDFWASWCGPCCREVPHLQQLERELDNKDVVFLSISIDITKEPWLKKMDQLKMHGNQWINTDGKVCQALNINSIPHFVIYNKEGKLMVYDADRPSSGEKLKNILNMLK